MIKPQVTTDIKGKSCKQITAEANKNADAWELLVGAKETRRLNETIKLDNRVMKKENRPKKEEILY